MEQPSGDSSEGAQRPGDREEKRAVRRALQASLDGATSAQPSSSTHWPTAASIDSPGQTPVAGARGQGGFGRLQMQCQSSMRGNCWYIRPSVLPGARVQVLCHRELQLRCGNLARTGHRRRWRRRRAQVGSGD